MPDHLKPAAIDSPMTVAAVDLGSNSFHMIVVEVHGTRRRVVDRLKEPVRLAAGLDSEGRLTQQARERALACLARFGERLTQLPSTHVRVVGTNTLRQARGLAGFLERAHEVLGHPIEIIYGVEEARLIYIGVTEDLQAAPRRRLVIDIGGGSTELVIGDDSAPLWTDSVSLGAVTHIGRFFPDGRISRAAWQRAVLDVHVALEPIARAYRATGWDIAVGASGSIKSILRAGGEEDPDARITPALLRKLGKRLLNAGHIDKLSIREISEERRAIFAGGLALLTGIFESLGIESMQVSDKALREGVIDDLIGRLSAHDTRDDGVAEAATSYRVDQAHGQRVAKTADCLLISAGIDDSAARQGLRWSAMLHESGLMIAHRAYHKHGEYLLANADLRGFSQTDQRLMATLVRLHRGRLRRDLIEALPGAWPQVALTMVLALRLAVILHRDRDPQARAPVTLAIEAARVTVTFEHGWLDSRPLTRTDLEHEAARLTQAGLALTIDQGPSEAAVGSAT